ncbi:GNAT family N-acetyltransferase [Ectobacillus sp. JY-23]|uniref:GNAT family N-acetyltransferase n=1 Tax=Ectobacillus sp. JY-23 TaxID=2933872 RepID=UPI001FF674C3|nr:GNAT family N-acetyltransferase [Ectobacillus sp. JY-23]UOY92022.1 GNAT family N-acetyltransferase [Ectobacillus sp. JY-23]
MKIDIVLEEHEKFTTFLTARIREFNNQHSIYHREARKEGAKQPIHIIISNENEEWVGGITGEVYWNWAEINKFWFTEEYRGQGLGTALLAQFEKISAEKGAEKILLTTFEFQARSFYESKGFKVVGEIKDYPPGSSYYTMVKDL